MDRPEILEIIVAQLPLRSQLACTLVSKQWYQVAHAHIWRYQLASFADQLETLRCFTLNRTTTSPSSTYFNSLGLLSNLVSLTISPDAHVSPDGINKRTGQYDANQLCLSALLPQLDTLRHLYIHGQDLRCRTAGRSSNAQLGGTDYALSLFAASRRQKRLGGLRTLSIVQSPDLTDEGILGYLGQQLVEDDEEYNLGSSLVSLSLVSCPGVRSRSLHALERSCSNLTQLTLRNVDGLFETSDQDLSETSDIRSPFEVFNSIISKNNQLHTFTFSSDLPTLPSDFFKAFDTPQSALQSLHLHPSKSITSKHLRCFPSIIKLSITGCTKIGDDLPFEHMSNLQELSFLGRGLSLLSLWKLFKTTDIRTITLDVAGSAYETCICSQKTSSAEHKGEASDLEAHSAAAGFSLEPFPHLLEDFKNHNILSSSLPSWVMAFFLSYAPPSLDSLSLHGTILPTCCSIPSAPSSTSASSRDLNALRESRITKFLSVWRHQLPVLGRSHFLDSVLNSMPDPLLQVWTTLFGQSTRRTKTLHDGLTVSEDAFESEDEASVRSFDTSTASEQDEVDLAGLDTDPGFGLIPPRRRRSQSISEVPAQKGAKVTRQPLKRSKSAFVTATSVMGPKERSEIKLKTLSEHSNAVCPAPTENCSSTIRTIDSLDQARPQTDLVPLQASSATRNTFIDTKERALAELLAIPTSSSVANAPSMSNAANVGTSRLNTQQFEWLHEVTQGCFIHLEL